MKVFKRIVSREGADDQRRGGKEITPGIWIDRAGELHFSVVDLLAHFGWPDDEEHRAIALRAVHDVARENGCQELIEQEERSN